MKMSFNFGPYCLKRNNLILADQILFDLPRGFFLELRGANGTGKTTLLHRLAGITDENEVLDKLESFSFYYFAHLNGFNPTLTVINQLEFSLEIFGNKFTQFELIQFLKKIGLEKYKNVQVRTLSQGQLKRLSLVIMSNSRREVWLIDEPFNALDKEAQGLFVSWLEAHLKNGGMAIISNHQSISDIFPNLKNYHYGTLNLGEGKSYLKENQGINFIYHYKLDKFFNSKLSFMDSFLWSIRLDFSLLIENPSNFIWPTLFFSMLLTLFPLATDATETTILNSSSSFEWIGILLTVLIASNQLFSSDKETGFLTQIYSNRLSLEAYCLAKLISSVFYYGLPIIIVSYLFGVLYNVPTVFLSTLVTSVTLGLVSLFALSGFFSSLALMTRQTQLISSLLAFPLFVPVLIFGTAASKLSISQFFDSAVGMVMLSIACLFILTLPILTAKLLKLSIE